MTTDNKQMPTKLLRKPFMETCCHWPLPSAAKQSGHPGAHIVLCRCTGKELGAAGRPCASASMGSFQMTSVCHL